MPYNGAGVFSIVNTFISGTTIFSSAVNANFTDIATGLSTAVLKNGTQTVTADIPMAGFGFTGLAKLSSQAVVTVASAATTDILGAASLLVAISGTATITSLGTGTNTIKFVRATGAFTLTHNATSLILPGGANIIMQSGDTFVAISDASSNVRIYALQRATGHPLVSMPGYRNILRRNGGCDINQRGFLSSIAVGASTTQYTIDGWYLTTGANQVSAVIIGTALGNGVGGSAKVSRNNGQTGTGTMRFAFPMDNSVVTSGFTPSEVTNCRGQILVLQFRAKAGANWSPTSGTLTYNLYFGTNAGVSVKRNATGYTSESTPITGSVNLTTTDTLYIAYATVAVGLTVTQAELQFSWAPTGTAGADDSFTIDDVQLEAIPALNAAPSPYELIQWSEQMALCQAHYYKTFSYPIIPAQNVGAGSSELRAACMQAAAGNNAGNSLTMRFPVNMRAAPTITTYNPSAANAQVRNITQAADHSVTAATADTNSLFSSSTGNAAGNVGNIIGVHLTADASI